MKNQDRSAAQPLSSGGRTDVPVKVFSGDDGKREWTLWNEDLDGWWANFYTPTEPYLRRSVMVSGIGPGMREKMVELKASVEQRERERGYVPLNELSREAVGFWAESDATWLAASILNHLAER